MGNLMFKDWNELSEASKDLTPRGKVRLLSEDPRSPTGEIRRTPIQVGQTPTRVASCNQLDELSDTPPGPTTEIGKMQPSSDKQIRKGNNAAAPESLHRKIFDRHPLRPTGNRADTQVDKMAAGGFMSAKTCMKLLDDDADENDLQTNNQVASKIHFD